MAQFEGSLQEFHHFLGPRIRNSINNLTRKFRNQRNGICENCGEKRELQSAHVHGKGRRTIIERVLIPYTISGIVRCNIEIVEKEILDAHQPIESSFKFLCQACHVAYDSNRDQRDKKTSIKSDNPKHVFKKLHRIELWATRPHQDNHKMIIAYLHLAESGPVMLSDFRNLCSKQTNSQFFVNNFDAHYASMKTDSGNSHGNVFYDLDGEVYVWPVVMQEIELHFNHT